MFKCSIDVYQKIKLKMYPLICTENILYANQSGAYINVERVISGFHLSFYLKYKTKNIINFMSESDLYFLNNLRNVTLLSYSELVRLPV